MPANSILSVALSIFLAAAAAASSDPFSPAPSGQPVPKVSLVYAAAPASSDTLVLTVHVELSPGWAINSNRPLEDDLVPASLEVSAPGVEFSPPRFPEPVLEHSDAMGGNVSMFKGVFDILVTGRLKTKAARRALKAGPPTHAVLHYQSCAGGMCYPPKTVAAEWSP
jgi:hypothetical protein